MKKIFVLLFSALVSLFSFAQQIEMPADNSIVKDTSGNIIPVVVWKQLLPTGQFILKQVPSESGNPEYIIYRKSEGDNDKKMGKVPAPKSSRYFKTGASFDHFIAKDLHGEMINTESLSGKIIVLNFWFINCKPCQKEIPELHNLAWANHTDSTVVFIAVALDKEYDLKQFLKYNPFDYHIIENGGYISNKYGIIYYPTNVVIDPAGKIYFHTTGYASNTV